MRVHRYSVLCLLVVVVSIIILGITSCTGPTQYSSVQLKGGASSQEIQEDVESLNSAKEMRSLKREFRGTWIQTVFQSQYAEMTTAEIKDVFIEQLDFLKKCGINAVVFQVRPEADAWYASELEPWSRFLTGKQGQAPEPFWDPMSFMIQECHKRNMEFHAWLNPYRVSASGGTNILARNHLYFKEPERFITYGKQIFFDPGVPSNRDFICNVIKDIITRYDVDAIHMDDYFYPYPIKGVTFPDDSSFKKYGIPFGWKEEQRADWRRDNVNRLIYEIKKTIVRNKPWVRFGISPFGIYRNANNTPDGSGSNTLGLQNYDDLYADILKWVKAGWIDYNIPQVYWEIGHQLADYITLVNWWNKNTVGVHLYIGQNVVRTMNMKELNEKLTLTRSLQGIGGNCFWPAGEILKNTEGIADELRTNYHKFPALIPPYTKMNKSLPPNIEDLSVEKTDTAYLLRWKTNKNPRNPVMPVYFVIYRVPDGADLDISKPENIVGITSDTFYKIPYRDRKMNYIYGVTAVNRFHNESPSALWKRLKP